MLVSRKVPSSLFSYIDKSILYDKGLGLFEDYSEKGEFYYYTIRPGGKKYIESSTLTFNNLLISEIETVFKKFNYSVDWNASRTCFWIYEEV